MYKITKSLEERLLPVKELSKSVNYDEDRLQVTDHEFFTEYAVLTISDKFTGKEANIALTPTEIEDYVDDFLKLIRFTETPLFWYLKDLATSSFKTRIFKEVKDVLLFRVSPLFETVASWEISDSEVVNQFETVAA